jgi:exonuclease V
MIHTYSEPCPKPTQSLTAGPSLPPPPPPPPPPSDEPREDDPDDFGEEITLDDDLQCVLLAVESQGHHINHDAPQAPSAVEVGNGERSMDIEDAIIDTRPRSPFEQFRKKGWLSVSDLVGTVWCEVQVRTFPFNPFQNG